MRRRSASVTMILPAVGRHETRAGETPMVLFADSDPRDPMSPGDVVRKGLSRLQGSQPAVALRRQAPVRGRCRVFSTEGYYRVIAAVMREKEARYDHFISDRDCCDT